MDDNLFYAIASVFIVFFSLSLPNVYRSEALLTPVASENSLSGALENLGSLGALAGNILPSQSNDSNSAKAMEKVTSLSFFEEKILPQIFLPNLMAFKSWSAGTNSVTYDDDIYDVIQIHGLEKYLSSNSSSECAGEPQSFFRTSGCGKRY